MWATTSAWESRKSCAYHVVVKVARYLAVMAELARVSKNDDAKLGWRCTCILQVGTITLLSSLNVFSPSRYTRCIF